MPDDRTLDERLFPAKVVAALVSLAAMTGYFVITLTRGPNDTYTVVVGVLTVGLGVAIVSTLVRRRQRQRGVRR